MNIVVIRHGKVDYKWRNWSTSEQFDMDCEEYNNALIIPLLLELPKKKYDKIYISSLPRSRETAMQIFGKKDFITTKLINEVPMRSSIISNVKLPLLFWNLSGRLQWLFNNSRQTECKKDTIRRAMQFINLLLQNEDDCAVITHGFFMLTLISCLKKSGFYVNHTKLKYSNGEYIIASIDLTAKHRIIE